MDTMDTWKSLNPRTLAAIGVVLAAVAGVAVQRPAVEAFGYGEMNWLGIAWACIPLAVLAITGARYYGGWVSLLIAAVITGAAVVAAGLLFVVALGLSLSGDSGSGGVFLLLLWVVPPLLIIVAGLAGLRFIPQRERPMY